MQAVELAFLIVAIPIVLILLTWVGVTVYRIYTPAKDVRAVDETLPLSWRALPESGEPLPIGVREIREDQRRGQRRSAAVRYRYAAGYSGGVPTAWIEELWERRN